MSKFKSFASQGSFRDYQLQAPDETAKIREETARTIRGKERAQAFLEENNRLYLQAQKLAQGLEEQNRETNFRLETENRQAFKDQLTEEYRIKTQAAADQAEAQQKNFKALSSFSKTAFELYGTIDAKITENQTKANAARAYAAGADFKTVAAIQALTDGLTKAEFAQQDFIRERLAEGGNIDGYFALYEARKTRGFINNIAVAQNTAYAFEGAYNKFLDEWGKQNPNATIAEKKIAFQTFRDEYAANFKDADGRALNPELLNSTVYPIMRRAETNFLQEADRLDKKEKEQTLYNNTVATLNLAYELKGAAGVTKWFTDNPSAQKREYLAKWMSAKATDLGPTGLNTDAIEAILNHPYSGPNTPQTGKLDSLMKQWSGTDFGKQLAQIYNDRRRAQVGAYNLNNTEQSIATETKIQQRVDEMVVDGDGVLSSQELAELEEIEKEGPAGFQSKALETARGFTVDAQVAGLLRDEFDKKLNAGTLTTQDILGVKGNFKLVQEYLPKAQALEQLRQSPSYKSDVAAIKAAVSQDPRIKAAPVTGDENYSVILMQDRYVQMYKQTLQQTGDSNQARSVTLAQIQNLLANPESINAQGQYTDIVKQEAAYAVKGQKTLKEYQGFLKRLATEPKFRTDAKKMAEALGPITVYNAYDDMKAGKEAPAIIKNSAALMGMAPLDYMNVLAEAAGQPRITLDSRIEDLKKTIKPITQRLYNGTYRTTQRVERANYMNNQSLSTAPTRGSYNVVQYVSNDPRFKDRTFGPIVYDEHGHGGRNMHVHYEFATQEEALAAKALYESKGFRISSYMRPSDAGSAHSKGFAIDVAPPVSLPYNEEDELNWIRSVNAVIGYDPTQIK